MSTPSSPVPSYAPPSPMALIDLRCRLGLSQHDLADILDAEVTLIADWEAGRLEPSRTDAQLLALFGRNLDALRFFAGSAGVSLPVCRLGTTLDG